MAVLRYVIDQFFALIRICVLHLFLLFLQFCKINFIHAVCSSVLLLFDQSLLLWLSCFDPALAFHRLLRLCFIVFVFVHETLMRLSVLLAVSPAILLQVSVLLLRTLESKELLAIVARALLVGIGGLARQHNPPRRVGRALKLLPNRIHLGDDLRQFIFVEDLTVQFFLP